MRDALKIDFGILLRSSIHVFACVVLAAAISSSTHARSQQSQQTSSQAPAGPSTVLFASNENYRIGANDVIEIQIDKWQQPSGMYAVSADGKILMKYLGAIEAGGKTVEELASELTESLRGRYLKDPQVTVIVRQYNSRSFFVRGAVKSPGMFVVIGKPSVMTLINLAGGLERDYGSTAFILRQVQNQKPEIETPRNESTIEENPPQEQYELLKANINRIYEGDFRENIFLEPGDTLYIPPADLCFILGEVARPGSFPLQRGMTLRQVIALSGGPTPNAKSSAAFILRQDPKGGEPVRIKIDLSDIMKAKDADIALQANDYIVVPNSRMKSFGRALLNMGGFGWVRIPGMN